MDNQIKDAVEYFKENPLIVDEDICITGDKHFQVLLDLAEKYLQASEVMPSKKEASNVSSNPVICFENQGWNDCLDARTFSFMKITDKWHKAGWNDREAELMKKMGNGLRERLGAVYCEKQHAHKEVDYSLLVSIEKVLQEYLMGREKV